MLDRDEPLAAGLGTLLSLIRGSQGLTRAELGDLTGLARSTVTARLAELVAEGLVVERPGEHSTGGRPASLFCFNAGAGVVLAIDAGASRIALAIADLSGEILRRAHRAAQHRRRPARTRCAGPAPSWTRCSPTLGRGRAEVRCIGVGLPGSVDFKTGRPVSPHRMPGWDAFPVADTLRAHFDAPVLVDNDVNVMALGEARQHDPSEQIVVVKAGSGIGLAYVTQGAVQRGAQGSAGEIGHIRAPADEDIVCRCGKHGCLEAVAGGAAMAAQLSERGIDCGGAADVARLARAGVPEAIAMVRAAGHAIGFVLAHRGQRPQPLAAGGRGRPDRGARLPLQRAARDRLPRRGHARDHRARDHARPRRRPRGADRGDDDGARARARAGLRPYGRSARYAAVEYGRLVSRGAGVYGAAREGTGAAAGTQHRRVSRRWRNADRRRDWCAFGRIRRC